MVKSPEAAAAPKKQEPMHKRVFSHVDAYDDGFQTVGVSSIDLHLSSSNLSSQDGGDSP